jgi:hypothetical protein
MLVSKTTLAGVAVAGKPPARTSLSFRIRAALLAVATLVLAVVPGLGQTAAAAPTLIYTYSGSAFGTKVNVGSVVKSGASAYIGLGCTANGNIHETNSTAGINLLPLVSSGTVSTTADTYTSPVRTKTTASTQNLSLLGGIVKATAIKAASTTTRTATGYEMSSEGTTFTGLVVEGKTISANAAPNTRIDLVGFGYIIINEQIKKSTGLTVNGLRLYISATNVLGLARGTNLIVSQAVSGLSVPVIGVLGGSAYGSYAKVGSAVISGPTFKASMPCLGTKGELRTNEGAGITIPLVGSTGTVTNTVRGTVNRTSATGEVTSTVQSANLLDGLVEATAIKANAKVSTDGTTYTVSGEGSGFGSLTVDGQSGINANVAPNTRVVLAGVGTLYLNRVLKSEKAVTVIMVQLILTSPVNGLAAGTDIRVAVANATVS